MSLFDAVFAAALPGARFVFLVLGVPVLVFGLVTLLVLPLSAWFEIRAAGRRRRDVPTLHDQWPSVSVIVPACNEATVIANCVRSIQLTRYDRYEVILVDDGSTDNTAQLMAELAAGDPRIKVLTQTNAGKAAALNLGIRNAAGDVLMFVDADGIFSRHTVEEMLQGFEDGRTGAVCGDDRPVNLNRAQTRMLPFISHIGAGMVRRALSMMGCLPAVSGNIVAFPRKVVEEVGLFREDTVGEDLELTWRVHRAGYRVVFAPRALVYAESPSTIAALWRQRVRRARGLLQTMAVHKGVIGNLRHGRFGAHLLFNAVTMVVRPLVQMVLILGLAFLLVLGYDPLGSDAWAVLGWGVIVTLVLTVGTVGMDRAWKNLRQVWALPLIPLYSVFTSLAMAAALGQELRHHLRRRLAGGPEVSVSGGAAAVAVTSSGMPDDDAWRALRRAWSQAAHKDGAGLSSSAPVALQRGVTLRLSEAAGPARSDPALDV
ncbi:glycosyltransferase family 2 protein [uncultured Arthrobacter sp.]|uniref:glycosyltransferase n=1 Tax=uncultured Arthrobacter sp. TaxID=114050 RepID=UPI003217B4DB